MPSYTTVANYKFYIYLRTCMCALYIIIFICVDEDNKCQPDAAICVTEVSTNTYMFIVTIYCSYKKLLSSHS